MQLPLENLGANSVDSLSLPLKSPPPVKTESSAEGPKKFNSKEYQRTYRAANLEKARATARRWYHNHKPEVIARINRENKAKADKAYGQLPSTKARRKELYRINHARRLAQAKASQRRNQKSQNAYRRRHRRENFQVKIAQWMRLVVWRAIRRDGGIKSDHTMKLLGCTIPELITHIESLFLPGMSWKARKLWHVDHRRPLNSFLLTDPVQQRAAFHYTNLQPLWAFDNQSKGDTWNG